MKYQQKFLLTVFFLFISMNIGFAQEDFELVHFKTEDGGSIEASLFKASERKIVIFAHGAIFNKESWYFLAEKFQKTGVSALPIDFRGYGNSKSGSINQKSYDILGAISFAKEQGYSEINIIGASMGGAAVLGALSTEGVEVNRVVLLAPAGGSPIKSSTTNKLFVISKEEGLYSRVVKFFEGSSKPKQLKEFEGSAHAQHLFKTNYASELEKLIIDFINPTK